MNEVKQCTKCHEVRPLAAFRSDKGARDGRYSWCRVCDAKRKREVHWAKQGIPESDWPRLHARHAQNKNMRQLNAIFGGKWCPECEQHLPREYFHRESRSADGLRGRCKTCELVRVTAYHRTDAGRAVRNGSHQRRRARLRDLPTDGSGPRDWAAHAEEVDDFRCHLCGGELTADDVIHWDHLDPISTGATGTVLHNMHAAHEACNLSRGNRPLADWWDSVELPDEAA